MKITVHSKSNVEINCSLEELMEIDDWSSVAHGAMHRAARDVRTPARIKRMIGNAHSHIVRWRNEIVRITPDIVKLVPESEDLTVLVIDLGNISN